MDKDIFHIHDILSSAEEPLTTMIISKRIFEKYESRLSRKITQNYLWSYFRNIIDYNASDYTYFLKEDCFLLDDIDVVSVKNPPRTLSSNFEGERIIVAFDSSISIKRLIEAITIINYRQQSTKKNIDLIKQVNRVIEQLEIDND